MAAITIPATPAGRDVSIKYGTNAVVFAAAPTTSAFMKFGREPAAWAPL